MFRDSGRLPSPTAFRRAIVEVDVDSGFVTLLKHWCVEDCGTVINPQLVDEQIRGGVVQGIGAALFEHCLYDERGQLLNGNMADYLVPMAAEMPDIEVGHVVTPTADSELGAKGAGEAGTAGAPAAVMNAINDALRPLGAKSLTEMPFTPGRILEALGRMRRLLQGLTTAREIIEMPDITGGERRALRERNAGDHGITQFARPSRTLASSIKAVSSAAA